MIGRKVQAHWYGPGTVIRWEPLSEGMTDALVDHGRDQLVWHASHGLIPIDDLGPLPDRVEARATARADAVRSLRVIRENLIATFDKPWPGAEHGKAIVGKAIDGAIASLGGEQ